MSLCMDIFFQFRFLPFGIYFSLFDKDSVGNTVRVGECWEIVWPAGSQRAAAEGIRAFLVWATRLYTCPKHSAIRVPRRSCLNHRVSQY